MSERSGVTWITIKKAPRPCLNLLGGGAFFSSDGRTIARFV